MKKLDIQSLLKDYNIPFASTGSKHTAPGWINIHCPFCEGQQDFHLGFHETKEYFNCWRCGTHKMETVIATLTGTTIYEAYTILNHYRTGRPIPLKSHAIALIRPNSVKLPGIPLLATPTTMPKLTPTIPFILQNKGKAAIVTTPHLAYLKKRGFVGVNLSQLLATYGLYGTGPIGPYNYRIIAPIYFDGNLVSYQGRDYTGKSLLKYKACPKTEEIRDHKNCLYGMDLVKGETVVVVEGVVDAWKLGPGAVATFGQSYTTAQIRLLVERWKRRIILFDKDAKTQANRLATTLSGFSGETLMVTLNDYKDPGELSVENGQEIMKILV